MTEDQGCLESSRWSLAAGRTTVFEWGSDCGFLGCSLWREVGPPNFGQVRINVVAASTPWKGAYSRSAPSSMHAHTMGWAGGFLGARPFPLMETAAPLTIHSGSVANLPGSRCGAAGDRWAGPRPGPKPGGETVLLGGWPGSPASWREMTPNRRPGLPGPASTHPEKRVKRLSPFPPRPGPSTWSAAQLGYGFWALIAVCGRYGTSTRILAYFGTVCATRSFMVPWARGWAGGGSAMFTCLPMRFFKALLFLVVWLGVFMVAMGAGMSGVKWGGLRQFDARVLEPCRTPMPSA